MKGKHRGEQEEVAYDRNTNVNWGDDKGNGFGGDGKSVCRGQVVKWWQEKKGEKESIEKEEEIIVAQV